MKCVASNKDISRRKLEEFGREQASKKVELYLRYALADRRRYSKDFTKRVFSSINKVIDEVENNHISVAKLQRIIEEKYNAVIFVDEDRKVPPGMKKDFASGVYSFMDRFNIILIYVLLEKYGMGGEKVNTILEYVSDIASSCNMGYTTEEEIEQVLLNEDNVPAQQLNAIKRHN